MNFAFDSRLDLGFRSLIAIFLKNILALLLILSRQAWRNCWADSDHLQRWSLHQGHCPREGLGQEGHLLSGGEYYRHEETRRRRHRQTSSYKRKPEVKVTNIIFARKMSKTIYQLATHERESFSELKFHGTIGLAYAILSHSWEGMDEVSLPFYLCLYLNP
jgi:hypothetical protein